MNPRDPSTCPKDTRRTQQTRKYPTCPGPSQARQERNIRQIRKLHTARPEWGANHISLNITCNHCKPLFIPLLFLKWFYRGTNLLESHKKKMGQETSNLDNTTIAGKTIYPPTCTTTNPFTSDTIAGEETLLRQAPSRPKLRAKVTSQDQKVRHTHIPKQAPSSLGTPPK